jgi:hypothetical protein
MRKTNPWKNHSLSIVVSCFLILWIYLYFISDQSKHLGAFYGNAIADWTGLLSMVLITKSFYEKGSVESKSPPPPSKNRLLRFLKNHSLSIFLLITGLIWVLLYYRMDPESKWGQVVGNIVSEWTQIFCLIVFTKGLIEKDSKESK